ncbi:MAG: DUF4290 domain-containing protein [Saprospiraceae bacterium]|nr:DUF4290 domain-containing protein [Saprospiraceae bacterium]
MQDISFSYNTQEEELIMPEYGRSVQNLVQYCKTVVDPVYRQAVAEGIVEIMQIMTPYNKNFEEHRKKLWHHLFRIAKYEIEVVPPGGQIPTPDLDVVKPETVEYPAAVERNRHYGGYVNAMIKKAMELEDKAKQEAFAVIIASYMKLAHKNWNKDNFISDEQIREDLSHMSKGILNVPEDAVLDISSGFTRHQRQRPPNQYKGGKGSKHKNRNKGRNQSQKRYY